MSMHGCAVGAEYQVFFIGTSIFLLHSMGEHSGSVVECLGCGFQPHQRHCVVSLSKTLYPCLVLVQPRETGPDLTEKLLIGT